MYNKHVCPDVSIETLYIIYSNFFYHLAQKTGLENRLKTGFDIWYKPLKKSKLKTNTKPVLQFKTETDKIGIGIIKKRNYN